jgi:hypothetical protein
MRLQPHPGERPAAAPRAVTGGAARLPGGALRLAFRIEAELAALRLPAPAAPARADGLWRHTCLEAFVRAEGGPGYVELNFSPSGAWAAYGFDGYRAGMRPLDLPAAPPARWTRAAGALALDAEVPAAALAALGPRPAAAGGTGTPLRVGLAAVIEDDSGTITHWALRHPADRPDFHHPEGFVLALPAP